MTAAATPDLWSGSQWPPRRCQDEGVRAALAHAGSPLIDSCTGSGKSMMISELAWYHRETMQPRDVVIVMTSRQDLVASLSESARHRLGDDVGVWYGRRKQWGRVVFSCYQSLPAVADEVAARGYRVALLICDEAHRLTTPARWGEVQRLDPIKRIALTATAYTGQGEPIPGWSICYSYRVIDAIRDGVLVRPEPRPWTGADGEGINTAALDMILRDAPPGPGVVSADSITDATWYAQILTAHGVPALDYHSRITPRERRRRLDALATGEIRALVHPRIMTEGVDVPCLRWLCLRVQRNLRDLVQEVGRGIRSLSEPDAWGTKDRCVVLDPRHQLPHVERIDPDGRTVHEGHDVEAILRALEGHEDPDGETETPAERKEREALEKAEDTVRRVSDVSAWCTIARDTLAIAGWIPPGEVTGWGDRWLLREPTARQRDALDKRRRTLRWFPPEYRDAIRVALDHPDHLTRGGARDLLSVLIAVSRRAGMHASGGGDQALGVANDLTRRHGWTATRGDILETLGRGWDITPRDLADTWLSRDWIRAEDLGSGRVTFTPAALEAVQARRAAGPRVLWTWTWPPEVELPPPPGDDGEE